MGLNPRQFMDCVIDPVLSKMECVLELPLHTNESRQLLLGTACAESQLTYLQQIDGPALGVFQVEPTSFEDVCNYVRRKGTAFQRKVAYCAFDTPYNDLAPAHHLVTNLRYACVIARLFYWRIPQPIPETLNMQAEYWKTYYNTSQGRGTVAHYISSFPPDMML